MAEKIKIPIIKHQSVITTEINGLYYQRMQAAYTVLVRLIGSDKAKEYMLTISKKAVGTLKGTEKDEAEAMETLLMFIATVEQEFKVAGLIENHEIEVPEEPSVD